jgi:L-rhamnose mutarotase
MPSFSLELPTIGVHQRFLLNRPGCERKRVDCRTDSLENVRMIRKAFVMSVHPSCEIEYASYSIFLNEQTRQLFAYAEIQDEARWAAIAQTEVCQRWWKYMSDVMPANADNSPASQSLKEVFRLEK